MKKMKGPLTFVKQTVTMTVIFFEALCIFDSLEAAHSVTYLLERGHNFEIFGVPPLRGGPLFLCSTHFCLNL